MKLKSGRSVIEIQKDGYKEVQPTEGCEQLTPSEWDEFCARTAKENNLRIVSESRKRVETNRAAFEADRKTRVSCDQCQLAMIQSVLCHETGCVNTYSRYDAESGEWVKRRKCGECGCSVDADDLCCNAEQEVA